MSKTDSLVTIIGNAFFQPIADLIFSLKLLPNSEANSVKVGDRQNGYSCSICLLSVIVIESFIMRSRYINKGKQLIDRRSCVDYLKSMYPAFDRVEEVREIFVLRDVIAHNHLWDIDFAWDEEVGMKLINAVKDTESGDSKHKNCVNKTTLKTEKLGLNVNPILIGKSEVVKTIEEMWKTLDYLEKKNKN